MRIVLSTFGTFGDVNPLVAIALELERRGHRAVLAVPEMFRAKIEPLGLGFYPVRPDQDAEDKRLVAMIYDRKKGTERGLRAFLFPSLPDSYNDLLHAVREEGGTDLLLTGELAYAGPIIAETTGVRWASYVLAPFSFFSRYDPPVLPPYPVLASVQSWVPATGRVIERFVRYVTRDWPEPVYRLRRELGLEPGPNPIFDAKHAPSLVLALFSRVLGQPQPDWPPQTLTTGFLYYDGAVDTPRLAPDMENFLSSGPAPVVFTLGSAAVLDAGDFYEQSAEAARRLGVRAVLLTGPDPTNLPRTALPPEIFCAAFAPYSLLFPRAAAIVHQGGVGTMAQALRAGKPMLVMPYSHDQPDNARRVRRLGVARVVTRRQYRAERVAHLLRGLLHQPRFYEKARSTAELLAGEDGLAQACDALERLARS